MKGGAIVGAGPRRGQRGAVLVVSLIILVVLTIIGLSAMRGTTLQQRMAGNVADRSVAFHAAEVALSGAEEWLLEQWKKGKLPVESASSMTCIGASAVVPLVLSRGSGDYFDSNFWSSKGCQYSGLTGGYGSAPYYVIEKLREGGAGDSVVVGGRPPSRKVYYQVTVRGTGRTSDAEVVLQTTFATRVSN